MTAAEAVAKRTRPPRRLTEGTLLTAMETAGRTLDDKELSAAMRETGLGTPATRAETIETLLRRAYIERQGKALAATEKGIRLIEVVHPQVKSPEMTGRWEAELKKIERREAKLPAFLQAIEDYVREVVGSTLQSTPRLQFADTERGGGRSLAGASAAGGAGVWRDPASARSGASASDAGYRSSASTDAGNHAVTGPAAGPLFSRHPRQAPSPSPPPPSFPAPPSPPSAWTSSSATPSASPPSAPSRRRSAAP